MAQSSHYQPGEAEMNAVQRKLTAQIPHCLNKKIIILYPSSGTLKWPNTSYRELTERLLHTYPNIIIVYTGTPDEVVKNKAIYEGLDTARIADLTGKTTLKELLALCALGHIFITSDTQSARQASRLNARTVVLSDTEPLNEVWATLIKHMV